MQQMQRYSLNGDGDGDGQHRLMPAFGSAPDILCPNNLIRLMFPKENKQSV